jgi:hypothetical protein
MHRPPSNKKRAVIRLSGSLEQKLIGYAAAATAAGVGILACSLPAEGKVITTLSWTEITPNTKVTLDLNNDGVADFQFSNRSYRTSEFSFGTLKVLPQDQKNAIWGTRGSASVLGSGVTVGSKGKFQSGHEFMGKESFGCHQYCYDGSSGQWKQITRSYLGFKFAIQGEIHYGWARMHVVATDKGMYAAVTEYAYETVPNKSIVTGQGGGTKRNREHRRGTDSGSERSAPSLPGGLGSLAAGALGSSARQKPGTGHE